MTAPTQDNPTERPHARLSASKSKMWMTCAGSIAMSELEAEQQSSAPAKLGTAAHSLGEHCLRHDEDADDWLGNWVGLDGELYVTKEAAPKGVELFEIDPDMTDAVQVYLDTVRGEVDRLQGALVIEHRFNLSWLRPDMFGTNDASVEDLVLQSELVVLDYKHGAGVPVEVVRNPQLMYYAVGKAHDCDWAFDLVTLIVIQPRCPHAGGSVRRWSISMADLKAWAHEELGPAAIAVERACEVAAETPVWEDVRTNLFRGGYLQPSTEGCKWCPALTNCPAAKAKVQEIARMEFADDPLELPAPTDREDLVKALEWVPFLDGFCKAVVRQSERLAQQEELPGYKFVHGRSTRKWKRDLNEGEIVTAMIGFGVDAEALYTEPELISGPAAEKLIRGKGSGKLKEQMAATLMDKFPGAPLLVRDTDEREAIKVSAQTDFEGVEE